ncbi:MAG: glutathione S-transferase [Proteobacteria bacterium]|jgi:glutathione S-transferase|nr:glutathione S-transferase [Pseudomonadota bacterium]
MEQIPILYSFRRCPYAMRARLALYGCQIKCELREVVLRDKPNEMIKISPKATVPVLLTPSGQVVDESYDIILWAIEQNDVQNWRKDLDKLKDLIKVTDFEFKPHLDKYKYSSRFPQLTKADYQNNAKFYLDYLESILKNHSFLSGNQQSITDLAVFPFVRQFANVDKPYFDDLPYSHLQSWLEHHTKSDLFQNIMKKYDPWTPQQEKIFFP